MLKLDRIKKKVEQAFSVQYSPSLTTMFSGNSIPASESGPRQFPEVSSNRKGKDVVLKNLRDLFGRVVLLTGEEFRLEEETNPLTADSPLWEFCQCSILPFGHALRYDLISKWCNLGREFTEEMPQQEKRVERFDTRVSSVIRLRFHPIIAL